MVHILVKLLRLFLHKQDYDNVVMNSPVYTSINVLPLQFVIFAVEFGTPVTGQSREKQRESTTTVECQISGHWKRSSLTPGQCNRIAFQHPKTMWIRTPKIIRISTVAAGLVELLHFDPAPSMHFTRVHQNVISQQHRCRQLLSACLQHHGLSLFNFFTRLSL